MIVHGSSPRARGARAGRVPPKPRPRLIPASAGSTHTVHYTAEGWWGSSPRARGARNTASHHAYAGRLIPASAGSTTAQRQIRGMGRGSSPRARGAHRADRLLKIARGLIPASAGSTAPCGAPRSARRAHPRERGEHATSLRATSSPTGSSPRARGALEFNLKQKLAGRAHPRERGEHARENPTPALPAGSSPRARGALDLNVMLPSPWGLIPASAGSTRSCGRMSRPIRAHPRERGEHAISGSAPQEYTGSSPRARGAQRRERGASSRHGLIPASAGSTTCPRTFRTGSWAHPRERGEHFWLATSTRMPPGSSPRARGALLRHRPHLLLVGLIPASAGSTDSSCSASGEPGAHPRERGEHSRAVSLASCVDGSSPRARGALGIVHVWEVVLGLIPASAGSTGFLGPVDDDPGAHPRERGEHRRFHVPPSVSPGSSPRARGALHLRQQGVTGRGLIPASAGSTNRPVRVRYGHWAHPRERGEHP